MNNDLPVLVDVDGVVADLNTEWLRRYNEEYDDSLTCDQLTGWDLTRFVKPECGGRIYKYLHQDDLYDGVQPIAGALEGIEALRVAGWRVVFLTSSTPAGAKGKMRWLDRHKFTERTRHNKDVIIAHDKALVRGAVLVDDGAHNVKAYPGYTVLFDAPHNQDYQTNFRAHNWSEALYQADYLAKWRTH